MLRHSPERRWQACVTLFMLSTTKRLGRASSERCRADAAASHTLPHTSSRQIRHSGGICARLGHSTRIPHPCESLDDSCVPHPPSHIRLSGRFLSLDDYYACPTPSFIGALARLGCSTRVPYAPSLAPGTTWPFNRLSQQRGQLHHC
jgi:hypothetical protein